MIKTITFAILHFSVAFSVAYILTGSIGVSSAVALVEPIVNTVVFLFSRKSVEPLREKQIREAKIVGASASVRLKFQTAFCLIKNRLWFFGSAIAIKMPNPKIE